MPDRATGVVPGSPGSPGAKRAPMAAGRGTQKRLSHGQGSPAKLSQHSPSKLGQSKKDVRSPEPTSPKSPGRHLSQDKNSASNQWSDVGERLDARMNRIQVSGRYHKPPRRIADDYDVSQIPLGTGCSGVVKLAYDKMDRQRTYAVKEFDFGEVRTLRRKQLESEIEIFLSMDHPNIARLHDVYENDRIITMVMEHIEGGELFHRLQEAKRFPEQQAADTAYQMLLALNYIHSHGIMHGDIKLENFMFDWKDSDNLKLIDFGFSKNFLASEEQALNSKLCGTIAYMAPEALDRNFTSQCDQWSLGVVVFVMLCGYMPFTGDHEEQIAKITEGKYVMKPARWDTVSDEAKDFVNSLLEMDRKTRLSAPQALDHPWIQACARRHVKAEIDASLAQELCDFSQHSKLRRICLLMIARSLSKEEASQASQFFYSMDDSRDGTISFDELAAFMQDKVDVTRGELMKAFEALDTNDDKEIHYTEFLAALVSTRIGIRDEHIYSAFRKFDVSGTGYITLNGMRHVLGNTFEGVKVEALMNEVDTERRGFITYHQFSAYVRGLPVRFMGDEEIDVAGVELRMSERSKARSSKRVSLKQQEGGDQDNEEAQSPKSPRSNSGAPAPPAGEQKHKKCCVVQ
eukprot:TRINITY_DN81633_c0_g1_i1.p1 TRINITY_DN81633_c0_g1~~TRINITY_DN81633_c0_g1_i1.p1  ORF type:complete len:630 (-),score=143.37 TRINITY_DN81633_c0_g1_i1:104-1993(-)